MSEMTAFCGVRCGNCLTYIATKNDDDAKRKEIADNWSKKFNGDFKPEQINCAGCKSDSGPLFFYCSMCEIKTCGQKKGVETCAHCDEYGCETLERFLGLSPENRQMLEALRKSL